MFMRLHLVLIICALAISSVQAKTYIRDYTYNANELDTKETSRIVALDQIKYILLSEIGTHIRHTINIKKDSSGNSYASEDVEAVTAGLTSVKILEEQWKKPIFYLKAEIIADANRVLNALEEFKKDKSEENLEQLELLKENQLALKAAREEIAQLRSMYQSVSSSQRKKFVSQYSNQVNQISLSEMFDRGYRHRKQGEYENAIHWFRKAAEQGHARSQFYLGNMYRHGKGIQKSFVQAVNWYRKAAEQEYPRAQHNMGMAYENGLGVKQDYAQAVHWYKKEADQGSFLGISALGVMYITGRGIKQDAVKGFYLIRKAAEAGYATAQYNLGTAYRKGNGVEKDYALSIEWYRKSASQGFTKAQYRLGLMYKNGDGVKQDNEFATKWFQKSCESGHKKACSKI